MVHHTYPVTAPGYQYSLLSMRLFLFKDHTCKTGHRNNSFCIDSGDTLYPAATFTIVSAAGDLLGFFLNDLHKQYVNFQNSFTYTPNPVRLTVICYHWQYKTYASQHLGEL